MVGMTNVQAPGPSRETARILAILCHLSLIISAIISVGILSFVGPLIFWLIFKNRDQLIRNAAAGSFNFAVTLTIVSWVAGILQFTVILAPLGWLLWIIVFVAGLVLGIIAALAASRYELYKYPLTIPILT